MSKSKKGRQKGGRGDTRSERVDLGAGTQHVRLAPLPAAALTWGEREQYTQAGNDDARWFRRNPGRRFRLRPATGAECKAFAGAGPVTHMLVEQVAPGHRQRHPACWSIPGPLPDDDRTLSALRGGAVMTETGGQA